MTGPRHYVLFTLRLIFGVSILVAAFQIGDLRSVIGAVRTLDASTFLVAFAVSTAGTIVLPAIVTSRTLRVGDVRVGLWDLIKINFAMRLYLLFLPHVVTVAMRWARYRGEQQGKGWQVAAMLLFERVVQFVAVVSFGFVFLVVSYADLPKTFRTLVVWSGLLTLLASTLLLMFISPRFFSVATPFIKFAVRRTPRRFSGRIERFVAAIADFQKIGHRSILFVLTWSVASYGLFVLSAFIVSQGLAIGVSFADIGWMRSAVLLLSILPITVGGLGVREVGFAMILHFYGVDESLALGLPLVLLAFTLLMGLIGAGLEIARVASDV